MDSPLRPLAGTDPAPCPDCGGDIDTKASEDSDGQWWDLDCPGCGWCAYEVESLAPFTLAGAPWTRALWAKVERLRTEAAELRLDLAAEQGLQEGAPSELWTFSKLTRSWHKEVLGGRSCYGVTRLRDGSAAWSLDAMTPNGTAPTMRAAMKAADEAEARAAAKESTP